MAIIPVLKVQTASKRNVNSNTTLCTAFFAPYALADMPRHCNKLCTFIASQ